VIPARCNHRLKSVPPINLMSTEPDQARSIASESPAKYLRHFSKSGSDSTTYARDSGNRSVRAGISDLQKKLIQLEARARAETIETSAQPTTHRPVANFVPPTHSPWLAGVKRHCDASDRRAFRCGRSRSSTSWSIIFKAKRHARSIRAASLVTTVRCAVREASDR